MATAVLESGRVSVRERGADINESLKKTLFGKVGSFVVGFLTEPKGKHSRYSIDEQRGMEKPERGIAGFALSKLFRRSRTGSITREPGPTRKSRPQHTISESQLPAHDTFQHRTTPEKPFETWREITPEEYLGTDRYTLRATIDRTSDFDAQERLAWKLDRLADNSKGSPERHEILNKLSATVYAKIDIDTSPSFISNTPYMREQRIAARRAAEAQSYPTEQLPRQQ